MLIFETSQANRNAYAQLPLLNKTVVKIPHQFLRKQAPRLPACSELQVTRHFTKLSQKNFAIDTHFYPLGSCTMKLNPRGIHKAASLAGFLNRHPLTPERLSQGTLTILYRLQTYLTEITGMDTVSLAPMAGSQGEFAGVAMIKAYHRAQSQGHRNEMLIPDAAHGTNPASAAICGYRIVEIATKDDGELDLEQLAQKLSSNTAGIMLTNPSTLGLFMRQIEKIAEMVHGAGGLLYYDGANLNAILGRVRPGDMGFDVVHLNLHKTFATPHGSGGPGSGPIGVSKRLKPYLPRPLVLKKEEGYRWALVEDFPDSIGKLSCFMGNTGILLRAYFYIRLLGSHGLLRVSEFATLNANYLLTKLHQIGYTPAYKDRRATHEFIISLKTEKKLYGISAMDLAKRLLDYGFHAPTAYFPLLIPECLLIEPTETECKQELDAFIEAMRLIYQECLDEPNLLVNAPNTLAIRRLDDVKAARELDVNFYASHHINNKV